MSIDHIAAIHSRNRIARTICLLIHHAPLDAVGSIATVSYTHLDVYKRQVITLMVFQVVMILAVTQCHITFFGKKQLLNTVLIDHIAAIHLSLIHI